MFEIAEGDRLTVVLSGSAFHAELLGSRKAVQFLLNCAQVHGGAHVAARFTTESPGTTATTKNPSSEKERRASSSGTAFYVSQAGHLITNAHVVEGCWVASIAPSGVPKGTARVLARDAVNDLALLETTMKPTEWARFRRHVRLGENVYAFGFPLSGFLSTSGNFTSGNVTAEAGPKDDARILQVSAPVQVGNSGGPLLDRTGQVVGVVVSTLNALVAFAVAKDIPQNVNFAIKSNIVELFLETQGVQLPTARGESKLLEPADVADVAKAISVAIECRPT